MMRIFLAFTLLLAALVVAGCSHTENTAANTVIPGPPMGAQPEAGAKTGGQIGPPPGAQPGAAMRQ